MNQPVGTSLQAQLRVNELLLFKGNNHTATVKFWITVEMSLSG